MIENKIPNNIVRAASDRLKRAQTDISNSIQQIRRGQPLKAEPSEERAMMRVASALNVDQATALRVVHYESPSELNLTPGQRRRAEALQGKTVDYLGVAWLEAGRLASSAVARIVDNAGAPIGTGFLVSSNLLITNNHVIPNQDAAQTMLAEFRFEEGNDGRALRPVRFRLDPGRFFVTNAEDNLDFTLVKLGAALDGGTQAREFGCCPLSDSQAKHSVGELANVVQHPDGGMKQIVIRENRILNRGQTVLHYTADTQPGSSGSPVFNDDWQVIALHHWGEPFRELLDPEGNPVARGVNEGIRISAIVDELRSIRERLQPPQRQLLDEALTAAPPSELGPLLAHPDRQPGDSRINRLGYNTANGNGRQPHGTSVWPAAFENEIQANGRGSTEGVGPERVQIDTRYSNRRGYNERFLRSFPIPLPQLSSKQRRQAARVRSSGDNPNPFELKYEHFSIVVNARRRMPFFSICNIDGSRRFTVDRGAGQVRSAEAAEATEAWAIDPRIEPEAQLDDAFYARVRRAMNGRDFFARGHMTRRQDPLWGSATSALRANADTFHHTNGCPQVQYAFNGSQRVWQGIENFILDAADEADARITVITGPIFGENDPVFEDEELGAIAFPRQFWKIVARVEEDRPLVFAVLADQSRAMEALFAARRETLFDWPRNLSREFQSSVSEIAALTGLDFGDLETFDVRGAESLPAPAESASSFAMLKTSRPSSAGFGRFPTISEFLETWESYRRVNVGSDNGERKKGKSAGSGRMEVEVEGTVTRVLSDDLSGGLHQQFTIHLQSPKNLPESLQGEVKKALDAGGEVRVVVAYGDGRTSLDRMQGIRAGAKLQLKGEWIPAQKAHELGGDPVPVLHHFRERVLPESTN